MCTHEPCREFGFQFQDNSRFCLCPRHAVRKPTIVQRQRLSKEASFGCNGTPLQISARGVFLFQSCHEIKSCAWSTNRPCLTPSCRLCQLIGHAIVSKRAVPGGGKCDVTSQIKQITPHTSVVTLILSSERINKYWGENVLTMMWGNRKWCLLFVDRNVKQ